MFSIINSYNKLIRKTWDNFWNYLNTLSVFEQGDLAHIMVGIIILFCILNLVFVYYSNILILKLKLKTKYSRGARGILETPFLWIILLLINNHILHKLCIICNKK